MACVVEAVVAEAKVLRELISSVILLASLCVEFELIIDVCSTYLKEGPRYSIYLFM
jgi:hypothetical protein